MSNTKIVERLITAAREKQHFCRLEVEPDGLVVSGTRGLGKFILCGRRSVTWEEIESGGINVLLKAIDDLANEVGSYHEGSNE